MSPLPSLSQQPSLPITSPSPKLSPPPQQKPVHTPLSTILIDIRCSLSLFAQPLLSTPPPSCIHNNHQPHLFAVPLSTTTTIAIYIQSPFYHHHISHFNILCPLYKRSPFVHCLLTTVTTTCHTVRQSHTNQPPHSPLHTLTPVIDEGSFKPTFPAQYKDMFVRAPVTSHVNFIVLHIHLYLCLAPTSPCLSCRMPLFSLSQPARPNSLGDLLYVA